MWHPRNLGLCTGAMLLTGGAAGQCTPKWMTPPPSLSSEVVTLISWDSDGPGPLPPLLVAATRSSGSQNIVAAWDGSAWLSLGWNPADSAVAFQVWSGSLVAAINDHAQGERVARWDGAAWTDLGTGHLPGLVDLGVNPAGQLIAVGTGGTVACRLEAALWLPYYSLGEAATAVISYRGDLILGGIINPDFNQPYWGVVRWNGSRWEPVGVPPANWIESFAIYQGDLITGSMWGVHRWNGTSWSAMATDAYVSGLAVFDGDLIAAGQFSSVGGVAASNIALFDGSSWHSLGTGLVGSLPVHAPALTVHNGDLFVGGRFSTAGGGPAGNIARYGCTPCYPNCDRSPAPAVLNVNDFICFQSRFAAADPYADCTGDHTLNVNDFVCFQSLFAAGCP